MVYEHAFLFNALRTILIILVVLYLIRLISKMMHRQNGTARHQENQQYREQTERDQTRRTIRDDGKTRLEYIRKPKNGGKDDDYADYEEVD